MRKISKDYIVYLVVVFVLLALVMVLRILGYLSQMQYMGLMWCLLGAAQVYWGYKYFKNHETFKIVLMMNLFTRKRNLENYDTERMIRDMGKVMFASGAIFVLSGVSLLMLEPLGLDWLLVFEIMMVILIADMAVLAAFFIFCRKSKYLKTH